MPTPSACLVNLYQLCRKQNLGLILEPPASNILLIRVEQKNKLPDITQWLSRNQFYLVFATSTDERELVDRCFKLFYLFSHEREDAIILVECPLVDHEDEINRIALTRYPSIENLYPYVTHFEDEIADMMGLLPNNSNDQPAISGRWLHENNYPSDLFPLRHDRTTEQIRFKIEQYRLSQASKSNLHVPSDEAPNRFGEWKLSVGPVHASVIEPGRFTFTLCREVIEEAHIDLGYAHKGIERLFQTSQDLFDGWQLAEHVCGDSVFAHSTAYCSAIEMLTKTRISSEASALRAVLIEIERLVNHIGDCAALLKDVAYDYGASNLERVREDAMQLCMNYFGHRLLRNICRPGGLVLPKPISTASLRSEITQIVHQFIWHIKPVLKVQSVVERFRWTGILTRLQVETLGGTGFVARASGVQRDSRLQHPFGVYTDPHIRKIIDESFSKYDNSVLQQKSRAGDVLARFLLRAREIEYAEKIINYITQNHLPEQLSTSMITQCEERNSKAYALGIGISEGWRGEIYYFVIKDAANGIFRCKVRDPSMLNWACLKAALEPHDLDTDYIQQAMPPLNHAETVLPDFPIVNKSFNLSYTGNDL